ncbi:MAG TPA: tRNA-uridine aminocarboxypropyltransferase [Myxococcaceae bacterium]|nr:tRNA-uridine aminocarboxypropyltransferase [Myxococcaceae bacterium]
MRHASPSGLPGRCGQCFLPDQLCLCADIPQLVTRTRFLLVRHANETWKSTNTARLAALALPGTQILTYGDRERSFNEGALNLEDACVLFPESEGACTPARRPAQVVVLDGSWAQARRMLHRVPAFRTLPRLSLPPRPTAALRRLRQGRTANAMSTLEAVAGAVAVLEDEASARALERLYALFVHRVLQTRGEA